MRFLLIACFLLFGSLNVYAETSTPPPVNLNQATVPQLMTLKGIGKKRAQAIFDYRQAHGNFHELKDLLAVQGMNQKLLDKLEKNNEGRVILKN